MAYYKEEQNENYKIIQQPLVWNLDCCPILAINSQCSNISLTVANWNNYKFSSHACFVFACALIHMLFIWLLLLRMLDIYNYY